MAQNSIIGSVSLSGSLLAGNCIPSDTSLLTKFHVPPSFRRFKDITPVVWKPPAVRWVKVNTDGSICNSFASCGASSVIGEWLRRSLQTLFLPWNMLLVSIRTWFLSVFGPASIIVFNLVLLLSALIFIVKEIVVRIGWLLLSMIWLARFGLICYHLRCLSTSLGIGMTCLIIVFPKISVVYLPVMQCFDGFGWQPSWDVSGLLDV